MEIYSPIPTEEEKFSLMDKIRLGGVVFSALALDAPRLFFHKLVHMGDYSAERTEHDMSLDDDWTIKAYRRVLEKEIGPTEYRLGLTDQIHEIRKRRGLAETTPIEEM